MPWAAPDAPTPILRPKAAGRIAAPTPVPTDNLFRGPFAVSSTLCPPAGRLDRGPGNPGVRVGAQFRTTGQKVARALEGVIFDMDGVLATEPRQPCESLLWLSATSRPVVTGSEVSAKKPAPDIFLAAAAAMNLAPERCLVVEHAVLGVQAAKSAGSSCLGLTTSFSADPLREAGADWIARSFVHVPEPVLAAIGVVE